MSLNDNDLKAIAKIVKESIYGLEQDVSVLKQDVDTIKDRLDEHDRRFDRIESDITCIKVDLLENNVIRRLNTIEGCYLDASNRYIKNSDKFEDAITDIDIMKRAIQKNSADILELKKLQHA